MMREKVIVAGNWKMNLGRVTDAMAFLRKIKYRLGQLDRSQVVICPPFTVLDAVAQVLANSPVMLGAQTMHWKDSGAYTGAISPQMLADICQFAIIGHSERRQGMTFQPNPSVKGGFVDDEAVAFKARAALDHGIRPIICVGETREERESGQTSDVIQNQVRRSLEHLEPSTLGSVVIAYEPLWAIGSGEPTQPVEANRVAGIVIRGAIAERFCERVADQVNVLYGGSVDAANVADFVSAPEVDGVLVGGASIKPGFVELAASANRMY